MNLYLIHCGFYDEEISNGTYEFHVNFPVVAANIDDAKKAVRGEVDFQKKKMHIDGIQELKKVDGFEVHLTTKDSGPKTVIDNHLHRDL